MSTNRHLHVATDNHWLKVGGGGTQNGRENIHKTYIFYVCKIQNILINNFL